MSVFRQRVGVVDEIGLAIHLVANAVLVAIANLPPGHGAASFAPQPLPRLWGDSAGVPACDSFFARVAHMLVAFACRALHPARSIMMWQKIIAGRRAAKWARQKLSHWPSPAGSG